MTPEIVQFATLSKAERATLFSVRAIKIHDEIDLKAADVIDKVESLAHADTTASTIHAALSKLVTEDVLVRVDDPDDGHASLYLFADTETSAVLKNIVAARGAQQGFTVTGGEDDA